MRLLRKWRLITSLWIEKEIFSRVMQIGLFALKGYFAAKGTGDVGRIIVGNGKVLEKQVVFPDGIIFRFLVNLKFPPVTGGGRIGCNASDGQANLPERCYSYLLQE